MVTPSILRTPVPGAQALERCFLLLDQIAYAESPPTLAHLVRSSGLPRTTTLRLLGALERYGLVARQGPTYTVGRKALELASLWKAQVSFPVVVEPELDFLVEVSGETAHVCVRDGLESMCIARKESPQSIRLTLEVGSRLPLHAGAMEKTLLAYSPDHVIRHMMESYFAQITPNTITDRAALERELNKIRRLGYGESDGEVDEGAVAVAVPIRDAEGEVVATIGVSGLAHRLDETRRRDIRDALLGSASRISTELGYPVNSHF